MGNPGSSPDDTAQRKKSKFDVRIVNGLIMFYQHPPPPTPPPPTVYYTNTQAFGGVYNKSSAMINGTLRGTDQMAVSGGSKGGLHGAPPTDQNFLHFMKFLEKFVCWRLPTGNPGTASGCVLVILYSKNEPCGFVLKTMSNF